MSGVLDVAHKFLTGVKTSGSENVLAICPFHTKADGSPERSPSFAMNTQNGLWFCHSCKAHGNLAMFLEDIGCSPLLIERSFKYVLEEVSHCVTKKANPLRPNVLVNDPLREGLLGIFDKCPVALLEEGFQPETLKSCKIGFDTEHMRITFPLRDIAGRLVGISGRTVEDQVSPRYKIYDREYMKWDMPARTRMERSALLWNGHSVYPLAAHNQLDYLVVTEGFKACMWLIQSGITNTVALIGSWLSEDQKWILERIGVPIFLMLDNDAAGLKGTHYAGSILAKSLNVRIVEFNQKQPSDIEPNQVHSCIEHAKDYYLWATERKQENGIW